MEDQQTLEYERANSSKLRTNIHKEIHKSVCTQMGNTQKDKSKVKPYSFDAVLHCVNINTHGTHCTQRIHTVQVMYRQVLSSLLHARLCTVHKHSSENHPFTH